MKMFDEIDNQDGGRVAVGDAPTNNRQWQV
jgi:hypothetical protein